MAQGNYQNLLPLILKWEGGYSNHPEDNGGETNFGVTWQRYNQYRRDRGLPQQSVKNITQDEVAEIYKEYYYDKVRGDELPPGVDYAMFDFAVNSGHTRAIKFVQRILGVEEDGVLGPETINAINKADPEALSSQLNSERLSWLQGLSDWQHFGKGWANRVNDVAAVSTKVAAEGIANGYSPPVPEIVDTSKVASDLAPQTSPRPYVKPEMISPGTPGTTPVQNDPNWQNPYNNKNLAMFGGRNGDSFWHGWNSGHRWAHGNDYQDYSQHYREFTYQNKDGYIPVGERDGRTVYASPRPEYVNGSGVSRNAYVQEARKRGALIPTESEMKSLYDQATGVDMKTYPYGQGDPDAYVSEMNTRLAEAGVGPNDPYYAGKEFYRTDSVPENWNTGGTPGTPPVFGNSPGPAGPVSNPSPASQEAGLPEPTEEEGLWGRLKGTLGIGQGATESNGASGSWDTPETPSVPEPPVPQDVVVPTRDEQKRLGPEPVEPLIVPTVEEQRELGPEPVAPQPVPELNPDPTTPPPVQTVPTTPPPVEVAPVPESVYVTPSSVPYTGDSYTPPPPIQTSTLPPPIDSGVPAETGGSDLLSGIGGDLLKMGLSGLMRGGSGGMMLPPAPVVQAAPPPQVSTGPVMFNIRKKKDKDKA